MIPLAKRLTMLGIDLATVSTDGLLPDDSQIGVKLSPALVLPLLKHHQIISFEYNVLCSQLRAKDLGTITDDDAHTKEQLEAAYQLAQLLEVLYFIYLNIPREAERFYEDKACLRQHLQARGNQFNDNKLKKASSGFSLVKKVRDVSTTGNFFRLLFNRLFRILEPFISSLSHFAKIVDYWIKIGISIFGCIFYMPRLLVNLYGIVKHTLPLPKKWMSTEEKNLDPLLRLRIQLERRWFELANDTVWIAVGIMTCSFLVPALTPVATYITVGFYAYDVFLAAMRAYLELSRLGRLQSQYQDMLEKTDPEDIEEKESILTYKEQLDSHIRYQKMRFKLSVTTTTLLFIGMFLTIPLIAVNPAILVAALSFIIVVSVVNYAATRYIERFKPVDKIPSPPEVAAAESPARTSRSAGFFQPIRRVQSDNQFNKSPPPSDNVITMLPG